MTPREPIALAIQKGRHRSGFQSAGLRGLLDPFIGVDHFLMSEPTFPPHPHAGFNVLTYMLPRSAGSFINRASFDQAMTIAPGDLHWTVAGRGMVHEEVPAQRGVVCEGLQIFINLRSGQKLIEPSSLHQRASDTPSAQSAGAHVRAVLGEVTLGTQTLRSTLMPPTPVTMLDVWLSAGASISLPVPPGHNAFMLVIHGAVRASEAGPLFGADSGASLGISSSDRLVRLRAEPDSQVIVFSGQPIAEPVVSQGPFVMNTAEQIRDAMAAYRAGRMGTLAPYYG
jgi:redox-sensitive bicupin YhaK (pirin superfamily)